MRRKKANLLGMSLNSTRNYLERLSSLLFFLLCFSAYSTNYYVASTGDDSDGRTWLKAYDKIQDVFDNKDLGSGDTIFLAAETFSEDGIVAGGDDEDFVIKGVSMTTTIVDGTSMDRIFDFNGNGSVTILDLTIEDGKDLKNVQEGGGGIRWQTASSTLTIKNVKFEDCETNTSNQGGGILVDAASVILVLQDCEFNLCEANQGGAIYFNSASGEMKMDRCKIHNGATGAGSDGGSAMSLVGSSTDTITNCLFYENDCNSGVGALILSTGSKLLMNCTIVDNDGGGACSGVVFTNSTSSKMVNCVIDNNDGTDLKDYSSGSGTLDYCLYDSKDGTITATNSSTESPTYVDATNDDYRITSDSEGKNDGTLTDAPSIDIDSRARTGNPDIGCYEYGGFGGAGVFYMSTSGNNSTGIPGNSSFPFATFQYVFDNYNLEYGDSFYVFNGTYSENDIDPGTNDNNWVIQGESKTGVIIDGSSSNRIFQINESNDDGLRFRDFTVKNGSAGTGAGFNAYHNSAVTLTFENIIVHRCLAQSGFKVGGGMYFGYDVTATLSNCLLDSCIAGSSGGGIYIDGDNASARPTITISNSKLYQCRADDNDGGGIFVGEEKVLIMETDTVQGTYAGDQGGGVSISSSDPGTRVNLINCLFDTDTSIGNGACLDFMDSDTLLIKGTTFQNCRGERGAISHAGTGTEDGNDSITVINSTFTNNESVGTSSNVSGGGIVIYKCKFYMSGCTFTGNSCNSSDMNDTETQGGGALQLKYSSYGSEQAVTIDNTTFSNNFLGASITEGSGGAVMISDKCYPTFNNCTFSGNQNKLADGYAGAVYLGYKAKFNNCSFSANKANRGGGVFIDGGDSTFFTNCTFTQDTGSTSGGSIYENNFGDRVYLDSCVFDRCFAGTGGGVVSIWTDFEYTECTFKGCKSSSDGSAVYVGDGANFTNSLFYENTATGDYTIKGRSWSDIEFVHCTVADNTATSYGGIAMVDRNNDINIKNSIFYNNSGHDIYEESGDITVYYSLFESHSGTIALNDTIQGNPDFEDASDDNYDVSTTSRCVDAGDNTYNPTVDITEATRLGGANTVVDIGCFEQGNGVGSCPTTITWDGSTDNDWDDATNWTPENVPCGKDVVIADVDNEPTLNTKGDCRNLTINGAAILTWSSSDSLLVSGSLDINSTATINHTGSGVLLLSGATKNITADAGITVSTVPFTISGSYTFDDGISLDDLIVKTGGSATLTGGESYDLGGDVINAGTLTMSSASLSLEGNWNNSGTFDDGTSTVTFDGGENSTITDGDGIEFYKITINKDAVSDIVSEVADITVTVANDYTNTQGTYKVDGGTLDIGGTTKIDDGELWLSTGTLRADDADFDMNGGVLDIDAGIIDFDSGAGFDFVQDGGTVEIAGGTTDIGDDLEINGGKFQIDGGTVDVNDPNGTGGSGVELAGGELEVNGGTLNVGNQTHEGIDNTGGTLDINGGTINVKRDYYQTSGTFDISGGTLNLGLSSEGTFHLDNGTYHLTGGDIYSHKYSATQDEIEIHSDVTMGTVTGGTFHIEADDARSDLDVPSGMKIWNLTVNNTGYEVGLKRDITIGGNVQIDGGLIGTTINGYDLYVAGDWINNDADDDGTSSGAFEPKSTTSVIFNGTSTQRIRGTKTSQFNHLVVNKPNGGVDSVVLDTNVYVDGNLTLTDGQIISSWTDMLTVDFDNDEEQDIVGGDDSSYIDGPVIVNDYTATGTAYADTLKVPVGDGVNYAPVWLIPSSTVMTDWQIRYADTSARTKWGTNICAGELVNKVSDEDYFHINRVNGTADAKVRFYWNTNSNVGGASSINDLVVAHWNSGSSCWDSTRADTSLFTRDFDDKWIETEFNVDDFSPFAFASRHGSVLLPVDLMSFEAMYVPEMEMVNVKWYTATEINNDYFEVERKPDGGEWEYVGTMMGAGTTTLSQSYEMMDEEPVPGITHYRLKQVDLDGSYVYSDVRSVQFGNKSIKPEVLITTDQHRSIYLDVLTHHEMNAQIEVRDILGRQIHLSSEQIEAGRTQFVINGKILASGMYVITLSTVNQIYTNKIFID